MDVNLRHLRYFVTVAEEGQITRAAQRLFIAQPSLSQAILELERRLGVALLVRARSGVSLTTAGDHLLPRAKELLATAEAIVASTRRVTVPAVAVGVMPYMLGVLLELFAALDEHGAGAVTEVKTAELPRSIVDLRAGRLDALVLAYVPAKDDLVVQPFGWSPAVVLLSSTHPLTARPDLRLEELADETWPGAPPAMPAEYADTYWLTSRRGRRPRITHETPATPDEVWSLLASGRAVTAAPRWLAAAFEALGLAGDGAPVVARPLVDVEPFPLVIVRSRTPPNEHVHRLFAAAAALEGRR